MTRLSREKGFPSASKELFIEAWRYSLLHNNEKLLMATKEIDTWLLSTGHKDDKKKRQALLSVLEIYDEAFECEEFQSILKLAAVLTIKTDKEIFIVTDNTALHTLLTTNGQSFKPITSEAAVQKIKTLMK